MPFRYVKGDDGKPVMPEVCCSHPSPRISWWDSTDNPSSAGYGGFDQERCR